MEGHDNRPLIHYERNRRAGLGTRDAMADTAMGPPPLERQESVPMEIMNKCAYGEPSTKTIMIMGAVAAVLASITVYCIVSWARRSARAKFKAMIKSVFEEVDHDHGGTVPRGRQVPGATRYLSNSQAPSIPTSSTRPSFSSTYKLIKRSASSARSSPRSAIRWMKC